MMNQDQFHASQSDKWATKADPQIGWSGITKATPLKQYPAEEPNRTDPEKVISQLRENDNDAKKVNLNNIPCTDQILIEIFDDDAKQAFLWISNRLSNLLITSPLTHD